jgi:hypothetical protein
MTPQTIIRGAAADGLSLTISDRGNIRIRGKTEVVTRWAPVLRQYKPEILTALRQAVFDRDDFEERAAIMQYDGHLSREEAEQRAAAGQGHTLAAVRRWLN